uniref:Uncharacterized protein n=1 Tax=Anguilla anguilla TaxID=7936 RepID=A0A0E9S7A3_ANGAN
MVWGNIRRTIDGECKQAETLNQDVPQLLNSPFFRAQMSPG